MELVGKRVLKITGGLWNTDSRDRRELSLYRELGADVMVMAKGEIGDDFREEEVDGYKVYRFSTRPLGSPVWLNIPNRILSLFIWSFKVKKLSVDVISGHDLSGLFIGWLSTWFMPRDRRPKLIYDSHEFELGRVARRNGCTLWFVKHLERFLMKRCAFSIMVNDSIADEVRRIHNLEARPIVVRSTPPNWRLDTAEIAGTRAMYRGELKVPSDTFFMMYHGAVLPDRGIENLLHALAGTQGTAAVILGNGAEEYLDRLRTLATQLGVGERALFLAAVPVGELSRYVAAADVGMITIPAACKSYYFMLPNKLFENIQSLTPVICSDFQEIGGLVRRYDIGLPVDTTDISNIVAAVEWLRTDKELYARFKQNLLRAKEELCWENEQEVLRSACLALLGGIP